MVMCMVNTPIHSLLTQPGPVNHLTQHAYATVNLFRCGTTVGQAQVMVAIDWIHKEPCSRRQRYPFLEGQAPDMVREDAPGQTEPDEKASSRVRPLYINGHVLLQSGERSIAAHFVQRPHALNMLLPRAIPAVLGDNACCERVRSPTHLRRPAVDRAPDDALGPEQPSQPQARRKRFGE